MDRNGFATVFLVFLIVADFSDASSLLFNLRKFVVIKDSVPGSPVPIPDQVSGEKHLDSKLGNGKDDKDNKLDQNSVNEADNKDKKLDPKTVNGEDKEKSNTKPVNEPRKDSNLENKPEKKLDPKSEKENSEKKTLKPKPEKENSDKKKLEPKPEKENGEKKKLEPKPAKETREEKKSDPKIADKTSSGKEMDPHKVDKTGDKPKDSPIKPNDKETANSQPQSGKTEEKKKEEKSDPGTVTDESCDGLKPSCTITNDLVACIKSSNGSQVVVLIQNKGESNITINISVQNTHKELEIPKKRSKLISKTFTNGKNADIGLSRGKDVCPLHLPTPASEEASFLRFPSYEKLVTPVNGAYFLILTALVFGGTWTSIKFCRRRRQGGIPYQELEMALPESVSAADLETAEGWDQGWDDDWDDDNAVKSPGPRLVGSISANGLTSRTPNKDGWEDSWDD